ncbi:SMP-30/gluconolactonase/LRE family protein [Kitasatospora sp. NPDC002965]|uniref:SMP-30/gluconolactonase/LRE family protein n=1 Tax=Kitasatospora sp. NPDC002965 TaxID=3154775 RepID=UPI0033BE3351
MSPTDLPSRGVPRALGNPHELGEGARWIHDRTVWVDLLAGELWEHRPATDATRRLLSLDVPLGAVAPLQDGSGWIAACDTGIAVLRDGRPDWIDRPEDGAPTRMRMNDGCADPRGRFVAGSMAFDATPGSGSLYRTDTDGSVTKILDGLTIPNGPAFSPDGTVMYLADSALRRIDAYPYDLEHGTLGTPRLLARLRPDEGVPDGMAVDRDGNVWSAEWGGARLRHYSPDGDLLRVLALPARQPTSCAFGGPDLTDLYVTTAALGLNAPGPVDGRTLLLPAPCAGLPTAAARLT